MKLYGRTVVVQDNNVERALRKFKRKINDSGLLMELRERKTYMKPTTRKKLKRSQARARWQKYLRSQQLPAKKY